MQCGADQSETGAYGTACGAHAQTLLPGVNWMIASLQTLDIGLLKFLDTAAFRLMYLTPSFHTYKLPYSIRILLESAIRNFDNFQVTKNDVEKIIDWENTSPKQVEIPFKPACVLLQDFTGVPSVVDLACMQDAMNKLGSDSNKINPLVPVDLVLCRCYILICAGCLLRMKLKRL
ncbi:uncharacterized protein A4U43_C06F8920 [Asparagus officinalis]|uniref:Aconitase/3-isopropylmalate dehydratase large subunit alpha/beta/alpha domain-containing protein n=1 Tax=Asparagus officinalis TaxID=4686 RepID=A0A5P1EKI6_ASPOF|nr:uncharacterized protein A4U43_C06F8920 [Asparagus officinalis]